MPYPRGHQLLLRGGGVDEQDVGVALLAHLEGLPAADGHRLHAVARASSKAGTSTSRRPESWVEVVVARMRSFDPAGDAAARLLGTVTAGVARAHQWAGAVAAAPEQAARIATVQTRSVRRTAPETPFP